MSTTKNARTRTDFLALTISAGPGRRVTADGLTRYRYTVTVQSDATDARTRFDFTASAHDYERGIDQLDRDALLYALRCFADDAAAGAQSFDEFADEYGYDRDSYSARRTWEACRAAARKFGRLWHDQREPEWLLDQLAAAGIE